MNRQLLKNILEDYKSYWLDSSTLYPGRKLRHDISIWKQFTAFINTSANCFARSHPTGHVTGSALLVNPTMDQFLLMHHAKLNKWLQMGGHADGHPIPHETAMREAEEETGLRQLSFLNYEGDLGITTDLAPLPFDIDIHKIPARKSEPLHFHYDVRYIIVADPNIPLRGNEESNDIRWLSPDEALSLTCEESMVRQFAKVRYLKANLIP